jgi:antibiotic biosynthesis monooxygenase (ABM) superfamily enzyme
LFDILPVLKTQYVAGLIGTGIITALMTYLIMPNLTSWLHGWLFDQGR